MYKMLPRIVLLVVALACLRLVVRQELEAEHGPAIGTASATRPQRGWKMRSCIKCLSVQSREAAQASEPNVDASSESEAALWSWRFQASDSTTCQHEWKGSVSRSVGNVANGQLVLLRKNDTYGAFMLTGQGTTKQRIRWRGILPQIYKDSSQRRAQFIWRFGTDPNGGFDTRSSEVEWSDDPKRVWDKGGEWMIAFGPFALEWSNCTKDKGWIYYTRAAIHTLREDDLAICVTNLRSFDGVNPRDPNWLYRRSTVDGL